MSGATAWCKGSWSRNAHFCSACLQLPCRSTSTTRPGCASGAPSRQPDGPYTVPSRLIGKEVQIRLYAERLEVYYKGHLVERMERVRGEREANVNYRHVHRLLGAQARGLRPLPLPGADVSHHDLPLGLRRPQEVAEANGLTWSTCGSCTLRRQLWSRRWTAP